MIAVIFEVEPAEGRRDAYLSIAAELHPLLDGIDGFLSIERFQSLADPNRILSLSFWRDEDAVKAWRTTEEHRQRRPPGAAASFPATGCASPTLCAITGCTSSDKRRPTAGWCMDSAAGRGVARRKCASALAPFTGRGTAARAKASGAG